MFSGYGSNTVLQPRPGVISIFGEVWHLVSLPFKLVSYARLNFRSSLFKRYKKNYSIFNQQSVKQKIHKFKKVTHIPENSNFFHQIFSGVPVASKIRVKLQGPTRTDFVWSCGLYVAIVRRKIERYNHTPVTFIPGLPYRKWLFPITS